MGRVLWSKTLLACVVPGGEIATKVAPAVDKELCAGCKCALPAQSSTHCSKYTLPRESPPHLLCPLQRPCGLTQTHTCMHEYVYTYVHLRIDL